ncbi:hypothetical protein GCM10010869_54830 [Mesorhizobium tianshanense]|nr:hypothetical protein GCM10010869_54830 [Mesorhizobium tianshanense]
MNCSEPAVNWFFLLNFVALDRPAQIRLANIALSPPSPDAVAGREFAVSGGSLGRPVPEAWNATSRAGEAISYLLGGT